MSEIKTHRERPIESRLIRHLYDDVNWWSERRIEDIESMLDRDPDQAYGLWDDSRLAGFCRLISDGVFRGYVEDFVIAKRCRGRGFGRELLREVLERNSDIHVISLFGDKALVEYYESVGLRLSGKQRVLHYSNKTQQQDRGRD